MDIWLVIVIALAVVIIVGIIVVRSRTRRQPPPDDRTVETTPAPAPPPGAFDEEPWASYENDLHLDDDYDEAFGSDGRNMEQPCSAGPGGHFSAELPTGAPGHEPAASYLVDEEASFPAGFADDFYVNDVPLRHSENPLPHDGLFVRRNNAFGTRSTHGIADLIDNGVMIDQTHIRFDDFVVSRTDQVPSPPAGEGIAVSHGTNSVAGDFRAKDRTTHFIEIALKAGAPAEASEDPRESPPVNFVFVVDVSSSMYGLKLDTVKTAIRELHTQLRDSDVLGIVAFNEEVRTVLKATPKAQLTDEELTRVVGGLRASGGTDINLGLLYGADETARHADDHPGMVNHIYLFSDGDPTSGERNWITIRKNIAARTRGGLTLSCFGFGSDARMRELDALAGLTGGFSTLVIEPEDVRLNLAEDLTRREHLAAVNIQLKVEIDADVTVWHLYGHDLVDDPTFRAQVVRDAQVARQQARDAYGVESLPDLISDEKGIRIFAPDLAFDETYWIVLEVEAPAGHPGTGFGTATVRYVDVVARENREHEITLDDQGAIPRETVFAHAVGLWTSEITFYALDDLYANDRETATTRLSNHVQTLRAANTVVPNPQFKDDSITFLKFISLTRNLGTMRSVVDGGQAYTEYALNKFGQVRYGFTRH